MVSEVVAVKERPNCLNDLPDEALISIFEALDYREIMMCRKVTHIEQHRERPAELYRVSPRCADYGAT